MLKSGGELELGCMKPVSIFQNYSSVLGQFFYERTYNAYELMSAEQTITSQITFPEGLRTDRRKYNFIQYVVINEFKCVDHFVKIGCSVVLAMLTK